MSLAEVFEHALGGTDEVAFKAYDGSFAGPPDAGVVLEVRSPLALRYVVTSPGDLGLARAYVTGHLEVHGDLFRALQTLTQARIGDLDWAQRLEVLKAAGGIAALRRPPLPSVEHRRSLHRRHSKSRDAKVISHHYDVSNRFYEWVLGPSMAYTCATYPTVGLLARTGPDRQVRPGRAQARTQAGDATARRRLRLGRHGAARRPRVRGERSRGHVVRQPGGLGQARDRPRPAWRAAPKSDTLTIGMCSRPTSTRSPRSA